MASTVFNRNSRALSGLKLAVAGGGVLGLSIAALAARAGARVTVFEPRPLGDNASGVAAGMLSPAFEAVLDGGAPSHHALLQAGYDAWPRFAEALGLPPLADHAAGALYLADPPELDALAERLEALDAAPERLTAAAARALQPALPPGGPGALHVRRDGRLDPPALLAALAERLREAGGARVAAPCPPPPVQGFDATVLAAGYETRRWLALAPELAALQPIKGHVLHFQGGAISGPTVRSPLGYAAPQHGGLIFGATMEPGRADLALDSDIVTRLHAAVLALMPGLADTPFVARTGVRAATADGAPLVGRSQSGLYLAVGARRNGWLLAPVICAAVLEELKGAASRAGAGRAVAGQVATARA